MSESPTDALRDQLSDHSATPSLAETLHLFLEGQPASAADQEPWEIFVPWLTGHDPVAIGQRLSQLKDGQPAPAVVLWQPAPSEDQVDARLASADRRSVKVFRELLKQERKSSKYYHEMTNAFERNSGEPRLARLLMSYLLRWEGLDSASNFARNQLALHPDWHNLRFAWASQVMFRTSPRTPEPAQLALFLEILQHKLLLEQHLPEGQLPEADTALLFYQATGFYYLLQRQLEHAVFPINQAASIDPDSPLLMVIMMAATAICIENADRAKQLRDFLRPLMISK